MSLPITDHDLLPPTDQMLNQPATAISLEEVTSPAVQAVIDRMLELAAGKGHSQHDSRQMVGLAAPQLGYRQRIIVIDVTADGSHKQQNLHAYINPHITQQSADTVPGREGCWSCGDICGNVERASSVSLEALDRAGKPIMLELTGFVARIAQHEVDHLDGIRFPDRIPANQPDRLHWVKPEEFADYRLQWASWPHLCSRHTWKIMKQGEQ